MDDLGSALRSVLVRLRVSPPSGYYYSSHSMRIGSFNELVVLGYRREFIMRRLDRSSAQTLLVYTDSIIHPSASSRWFFAHLESPL